MFDRACSVGYIGVLESAPQPDRPEAERVVQLRSLPTKVFLAVGLVLLIGSMGVSAAVLKRTAVASCGPSTIVPTVLYSVTNDMGVAPGVTAPSTFHVASSTNILSMKTYHYVYPGGLSSTGQIGLKSSDGKIYGPWQTTGSPGIHDVPNANWNVSIDIVLPPGTYTVTDSDPSTWSSNIGTKGEGIFWVTGWP